MNCSNEIPMLLQAALTIFMSSACFLFVAIGYSILKGRA